MNFVSLLIILNFVSVIISNINWLGVGKKETIFVNVNSCKSFIAGETVNIGDTLYFKEDMFGDADKLVFKM